MNSTERVRNTISGKPTDRQPIYGWVSANLSDEICQKWGSVENFEDKYEFDMAHIFGGPNPFKQDIIEKISNENDELTPDLLVDENIFTSPDNKDDYSKISDSIEFHKKRDRFCYVQTPGFFENFNSVFGIENQLMYLAMYPEELEKLYKRQTEWTVQYADMCIENGADMIHISDDWGSQKDLMFNPALWHEIIYPQLKTVIDHVHSKGAYVSLHSDGCISRVTDSLAELGFDVIHPWQESAGMSYDMYLEKYSDQFTILGGVCVQTAIGVLPKDKLEEEIRRVFAKLRGKRWICCTSHFVQNHCSMEDLELAYDLIYSLARK